MRELSLRGQTTIGAVALGQELGVVVRDAVERCKLGEYDGKHHVGPNMTEKWRKIEQFKRSVSYSIF